MALVQACCCAPWWRASGKTLPQALVRWGTEVARSLYVAALHLAGHEVRGGGPAGPRLPFDLDWLAAFEEFRFPHYGRVQLDDIELELRWAVEPWHVLGRNHQFGTSRYVDSSVERLQLKATGLTEGRYVLSCNGRQVPMRTTGRHGEYVGCALPGVAATLGPAPLIGVHVPWYLTSSIPGTAAPLAAAATTCRPPGRAQL